MKSRAESWVYLFGVFLFGVSYAWVKEFFGGGFWFLLAAIAYLLALSFVATSVRSYVERRGTARPESNG